VVSCVETAREKLYPPCTSFCSQGQASSWSSIVWPDIFIGSLHPLLACRGLKKERRDRERQEWRSDKLCRNNLAESIVNVLREMWDQQLEIPLIASFRKEASISK